MRHCYIHNLISQIGQTLKLNDQLTFFGEWYLFAKKYITLGSVLQKKKTHKVVFAQIDLYIK